VIGLIVPAAVVPSFTAVAVVEGAAALVVSKNVEFAMYHSFTRISHNFVAYVFQTTSLQ